MGKVFPIKGKLEAALIIPDVHSPYEHQPTIDIATQIAKDLKPKHLVFIGDCFDAEHLGRWTKTTVEEGIYKTVKEIEHFKNRVYLPLVKACGKPKVYWTGGNHDMQRIKEVIEEMPERAELLDLKKHFPDCTMCEYGEYIKIGKIVYTHGTYHNDAHAKKHAMNFMANVVYGHTHTHQVYVHPSRLDQHPHKATSIGAACELNPGYMKNRPNSWVNAVAVAYYQKNGNYNLYVIEINQNKCVFNGKLYESKK